MAGKARRTWVYCQAPKVYEMAPCDCGNEDTQWSEFEGHLWCEVCQKDFIPKGNGIFDGPIPMHLSHLMGIRFDRIIILSGEVELYNMSTHQWQKGRKNETGNANDPTREA